MHSIYGVCLITLHLPSISDKHNAAERKSFSVRLATSISTAASNIERQIKSSTTCGCLDQPCWFCCLNFYTFNWNV